MNKEIGRHIRQLRAVNHMTQDDLAQQLHVTRQNISSWETGKSSVSVEYLTALSTHFDVSIEELIYGPSPNRPYQKFQRRYFAYIGICGTLLLLALLSKFVVLPHILCIQSTTFLTVYGVLYTIILRLLSSSLVGIILCALVSLWGDLRLRNLSRRIVLSVGIILIATVLFFTGLVFLLYCCPQSWFGSRPIFLSLYRFWVTTKTIQLILPFAGSILIFGGCNR